MFPPSTRVLTVDDAPAMREFVSMQLRALGINRIYQARNGKEALELVKYQMQKEIPIELIISDWNMPEMTGLDFLKHIRANQLTAHVPFVLLTAETEKAQVTEAVISGVSNYILKPFTAKSFEEKLKAVWLKCSKTIPA
jgi:two-component system chemotaxis response regulator CheY